MRVCIQTPKEWSKWLALAIWWYNTSYHSASQLTPYEIVYNHHLLCTYPISPVNHHT